MFFRLRSVSRLFLEDKTYLALSLRLRRNFKWLNVRCISVRFSLPMVQGLRTPVLTSIGKFYTFIHLTSECKSKSETERRFNTKFQTHYFTSFILSTFLPFPHYLYLESSFTSIYKTVLIMYTTLLSPEPLKSISVKDLQKENRVNFHSNKNTTCENIYEYSCPYINEYWWSLEVTKVSWVKLA